MAQWGWSESGVLKASADAILRARFKDSDLKLYESKNHHRNFIDAVYSRGRTAATAEIAQRAANNCHIGAISAVLGRPLKFDPKSERFDNDDQANPMLLCPMREAWSIA